MFCLSEINIFIYWINRSINFKYCTTISLKTLPITDHTSNLAIGPKYIIQILLIWLTKFQVLLGHITDELNFGKEKSTRLKCFRLRFIVFDPREVRYWMHSMNLQCRLAGGLSKSLPSSPVPNRPQPTVSRSMPTEVSLGHGPTFPTPTDLYTGYILTTRIDLCISKCLSSFFCCLNDDHVSRRVVDYYIC